MKDFFNFMMGAMFGAVMIRMEEISKNKNSIKKKVNTLIDDTSKLVG